ncbi:MAG: transporter ATP-binding protein, partial [Flaviaesturariibacter sp.]|nr:transporter ATP-binding protein [Flaviaesturariibacter sp.]
LALSSRTGSDSSFLLIGTFMAAAYKIIPGLVKMINLAGQMKAYEFPVGTEQPEKRAQADALNCPSIEGLSLRNLSHAFAGRQVLDPVTLDVNPGDFVGIRGASGIGKTTLLNLLVGFLEPTGGTISVNGQRLAPRELRSLWPAVAYNRQQAFLMQDSISRNITLGKPLDEDRFQNIVRKTGLAEILATFAEGADRIIAENGRDLSGGQQQRICLARTFYKEADLILLDEPFNELDAASELRLLRYCRQLAASGKMILMISHHERSLSFCTKRFTLNDTRKDAHPAPAGLSEV